MAISVMTEARREELLRVARLNGENLSRIAFGERSPDLKVTLADLEQFLRPLVEAMAGGLLAVSATEQSQRITEQIGTELLQECEHQAALHQRRELPATNEKPVEIACVEVDGGRIRTRASGQGGGVHEHAWKETKVAALWRMEGPTFAQDTHPEPPACFLDDQHVPKMVREIKRQRSEQHLRTAENSEKTAAKPAVAEETLPQRSVKRQWPPQRVFRTCVSTLKDGYGFGPLVAAEAQRRGFYDAARQVFLGMGTIRTGRFTSSTSLTSPPSPISFTPSRISTKHLAQ